MDDFGRSQSWRPPDVQSFSPVIAGFVEGEVKPEPWTDHYFLAELGPAGDRSQYLYGVMAKLLKKPFCHPHCPLITDAITEDSIFHSSWGIEFNRSVPQGAATHWIPSALRYKWMPRETNTCCFETPWGKSCLQTGNNPSKQRWGLNQVEPEERHPLPGRFSPNALPDWLSRSLGHPTSPQRGFQFFGKSCGAGRFLIPSLKDSWKSLNDLSKWVTLWILQDESKWVAQGP